MKFCLQHFSVYDRCPYKNKSKNTHDVCTATSLQCLRFVTHITKPYHTIKNLILKILKDNKTTYMTCQNIRHIIKSKYNIPLPKAGTVSAILYKLTQSNTLERQENIGSRKGYGYKLIEEPIPETIVSIPSQNPHKNNITFRLELP